MTRLNPFILFEDNMAYLRRHYSRGTISQASGAAAAAMKARAASWDVPIVETSDQLSVLLWGGELRLTLQPQSMLVDLAAPEERLIGILRDCAIEMFAEVGLVVEWDRVDAGALAPNLALMRVVSIAPLTPGFLRVRLEGPEAARFGTGSLHFRLLLPPRGRAPVWPRIAQTGRTVWPDGEDTLHRPVYTVVDHGDDWLDFDIFRHADSPTCDWALSDPTGSEVGILGPGGGWCPDAPRLWLFGDETALPAITRMLNLATGDVHVVLSCAADDLGPLIGDDRVSTDEDLLRALKAHGSFTTGDFVWFAASSEQARSARSHLLEQGLSKKAFLASAYWG